MRYDSCERVSPAEAGHYVPPNDIVSGFSRTACLAIREEMRLHELVDGRLGGSIHLGELQAHADAAIGPRDARFGVEVASSAGKPEARLYDRADFLQACRPHRHAAVADVE